MNSSKNGGSSLDLAKKYNGQQPGSGSSSEAIHTMANGHQMISASSLPRYADGKWEKKKIRALNQQRKGSLDSRSFILAASPDIPPLPPSLSNHHSSYYPLPLLSLPSQPNLTAADVLAESQQDSDYFNSLHHRHHLHLHQHHLIDPANAGSGLVEPSSTSLLLSSLGQQGNTLARQNSLNYHHLLDQNASPGNVLAHPHSTGGLLPSAAFQSAANDSYLFSPSGGSAANACSHCSYELYDCHNLNSMGASCDLMLLPTSTSYHHLHFNKQLTSPPAGMDYQLHGNQYPTGHQCSTANEFSWTGYNDSRFEINDSLDYHQQNLNQSRSKEVSRVNGGHHHSGGLPIGSLAEEEPNEQPQADAQQCQSAGEEPNQTAEASDLMEDKSNRRNEAPNEEHSSTSRQSRLQRTQSFTVEEVDLSEACE